VREQAQAMLASIRTYWRAAQSYQRVLYFVGFLLVLSAMFHGVVLVAMRDSLEGDVSWRKPILFGESFGLTCVSVAWVMTFLAKWRFVGWLLSLALGLASAYEVIWVSFQQWRGVPSHFNNATPFDQSLFALAGISIGFTGIVILVVTIWAFVRLEAPPSFVWAIRVGLALLLLGQVFGIPMIQLGGHTFAPAGNMKVPHALALHGAQVLPLLACLLSLASWSETRRMRIIVAGAAGYCVLVAVGAFQAFRGQAPFNLSLATAFVLLVGATLLAGAYLTAVLGVRKMAH